MRTWKSKSIRGIPQVENLLPEPNNKIINRIKASRAGLSADDFTIEYPSRRNPAEIFIAAILLP